MDHSDYKADLDRMLDEVHGDPLNAARQEKFSRLFPEAYAGGVDFYKVIAEGRKAYSALKAMKANRSLVDAGMLCELDFVNNLLADAVKNNGR